MLLGIASWFCMAPGTHARDTEGQDVIAQGLRLSRGEGDLDMGIEETEGKDELY